MGWCYRERRAITHDRGSREGWGRARGARGRERLSRGCGEVCRGSGPTTVTLGGRGRSSVMGVGVTTPRRSASAVTLMPAVGGAAAPSTHSFSPCLEHRAVSVMCGKLGIEKGKYIREGGRAPTKAVFRRTTVATAAAILYTRLATGVLSEKGRPQGQVCIDHVICHGANNRIVSVIEGPEAIVNAKGVPAGVDM